jgi:hypothetical protein
MATVSEDNSGEDAVCDHEYAEVVSVDGSDDSVSECCHCGEILGRASPQDTIPDHWFQHTTPSTGGDSFCLGVDFLDVDEPPLNLDSYDDWMVQICPVCGGRLTAYHDGYAGMAADFKETACGHCFTPMFRHTTVITTQTDADQKPIHLNVQNLQRYIKKRADRAFWHGDMARVSPAMSCGMDTVPWPVCGAKVELNDVVETRWEPRCPCCGKSEVYLDEIDFHHWDYETDTGCNLCRECHSHIHRGKTATEQAKLSDGWRRDAVRRLFQRSTEHGLEFKRPFHFSHRFNIPTDKYDFDNAISVLFG